MSGSGKLDPATLVAALVWRLGGLVMIEEHEGADAENLALEEHHNQRSKTTRLAVKPAAQPLHFGADRGA